MKPKSGHVADQAAWPTGSQPQPKGARHVNLFIMHAREFMFFSLIAQTFTCLLLVLIWLQLKKK